MSIVRGCAIRAAAILRARLHRRPARAVFQIDRPAREADFLEIARRLHGHLTATVFGTDEDLRENRELLAILELKAGRRLVNSFPTGVEVGHAMVHGGPFPATSDSRPTSVGTAAVTRFTRPVCYQNFPDFLLPDALKNANPRGIRRKINGAFESAQ